MKYIIKEIRSWIFAIYIVLMLYLRECKYIGTKFILIQFTVRKIIVCVAPSSPWVIIYI